MPFDVLPATGLATDAHDRLHRFFSETTHGPSQEQWAAIRDLHDHLELAANGQLSEALYLSAIPPGTGKSTATAMFARALMDNPAFEATGMIVFVNRIVEAEAMAGLIGPAYRDKLCVITSKEEAKEAEKRLGAHTDANDAQVVVCTQAALKQTLKANGGITFGAASRFHFRGSRRAVVSWDESFAFNRPIVLNADVVVKLAEAMSRQSKEAATTLKRWSADVDTLTGLITVPDFEGLGVDFDRLEDAVGGDDDLVSVVKSLAILSGDEGFITSHGNSSALVTHFPEINPSLMPVIVADASAKVNASYVQMAKTRPVRWLTDAPKSYRNMTVRLVNTAASRSVYRDMKTTRGRDLLDLAVRYIESVPADESVLVVGYKGWFRMKGVEETNLELALRKRLKPADDKRMAYLTYGNHTATNDFKHVRHVMLLGLNFIPKAAGHAASGAALDLNLKNEHPSEDQIKAMQRGLLMDSTLQALLRGNARHGVEGDCGQMEVVIFQTKQTGLSVAEYRTMFPELVLVRDRALMPEKQLGGRLKELSEVVARRLATGESEMTNKSLYEELRMKKPNLLALVKKPEWQAWMATMDLYPARLSRGLSGLRKA